MKQIYLNALCALLILCTNSLFAQIDSAFAADLQAALDDNIEANGITGIEATVIMPDGCSWTGVSGDRAPGEDVTLDRKWTFASNTKMMTSYLILMLQDLDSLDIDDPFYDHIDPAIFPESVVNFPYVDSAITIRNLLNHTTNLPDIWDPGTALWQDIWGDPCPVWDLDDVLDSAYWVEPESEFDPPYDHDYSSNYSNYIILSYVLMSVLDDSIDNIFQDYIFDPLGMEDSYLGSNGIDMEDINGMYNNGVYNSSTCRSAYLSTRAGGGALISTSMDVATFVRSYYGGELLSEESMDDLLTYAPGDPTTVPVTFCAGDVESYYGLGTMITEMYTPNSSILIDKFYGHGGNGLGFVLTFYSSEHGYTVSMTHNDYYTGGISQLDYYTQFITLVCEVTDNLDSECQDVITVDEYSWNDLKIYPNPGSALINIELVSTVDRIRIMNNQGQTLIEEYPTQDKVTMDSSDLPPGIYLIEIERSGERRLKKWIKE